MNGFGISNTIASYSSGFHTYRNMTISSAYIMDSRLFSAAETSVSGQAIAVSIFERRHAGERGSANGQCFAELSYWGSPASYCVPISARIMYNVYLNISTCYYLYKRHLKKPELLCQLRGSAKNKSSPSKSA